MKPALARVLAAGLAVSCIVPSALAQWSTNPGANLKIADGSGEQVQPKIQPTADGGCYVSWFDNGSVNYKSDTWTWSGTAWTKSSASGPSARVRHGMAYDSARQRTVMFGGSSASGSLLADTWEWNGASWSQVAIAGPSGRERYSMAFDAAHNRVVLFGGLDSGSNPLGDTWVYDGTSWTHLFPASAPTARSDQAMTYDPVRQVVVLFGGFDAGGPESDTWEWNGTNWTQVTTPAAPSGRYGQSMAYDFVNSKVLLFGGRDSSGTALNDTWLYDGATWTQQSPATNPTARYGGAATNDFTASGVRVVVYGGFNGFNVGSMYEWSGTNWASKTTTPTSRSGPAMAYDSANSQSVMFGGMDLGGYDVYLQRLSVGGVEQWAHNGVQLCDRGVSSTVDYDMIVDSGGNAVVAYNDDQVAPGGVQQISVSKVSPAGTVLWKSTISQATSSASANSPHLTQLTDGTYVVAYSLSAPSPGVLVMQRLDSGGAPLWTAPGITLTEATHYESVSDIKPAGSGFALLWVRGQTNSLSNKGLRVQKFDTAGVPQWTGTQTGATAVTNAGTPVMVYLGQNGTGATSIQNGYFPTMVADGAGGVVLGWYENVTPFNAYIQHVLSDGSLKFAAPDANTGPTAPATRRRVGGGVAYNTGTGEYYLASPETDSSTQSQNSTFVQKFDSSGNRQWSDTGVTIIPISTAAQQSFVQCQPIGDGCMVFFEDTRSATTRVIDSARVNGDTTVAWHNLVNNDSSNDKSRLTSCMSTAGFAMIAYGWGNSGSVDIAAQNIKGDGTLGPLPVCYANCDASTTPPVLNVLDFACFLNRFASGDTYANCDASTTPPVLNVLDFACFLNAFATGCP